jgi:hypothetical protein
LKASQKKKPIRDAYVTSSSKKRERKEKIAVMKFSAQPSSVQSSICFVIKKNTFSGRKRR